MVMKKGGFTKPALFVGRKTEKRGVARMSMFSREYPLILSAALAKFI